jgi:hypothetical protein
MNNEKPGFNDVCEGCGSYVHCCSNCKFYDEYTRPHCGEPNADSALDPNGMNHCEYFVFRPTKGAPLEDPDDPEQRRMRRKPDWRNMHNDEQEATPRPRNGQRSESRNGGMGIPAPDAEERAKKARQNLDKLFGK